MVTAPDFRLKSPEEKRAHVLANGTLTKLLRCPVCAKASAMKNFYSEIDIKSIELIDLRMTGGKGSGFYRVGTEKTLLEMKNDPKYRELLNLMRERCRDVLEIIEE